MTVTPSWRAAASSAFSVTVSPRSVSTIGRPGVTERSTSAWYSPSVAVMSRPNRRRAIMCGSIVRVPRSQPPAYGSLKWSIRCSSGPRNMMIERVRRAAAASMASRSTSAGGTISRSTPPLIHRVRTPMEPSTSRRRYTSSMRATRRSTVRPLFNKVAHSSATHAFLLVFTSIAPDSRRPPTTRRCIGPA